MDFSLEKGFCGPALFAIMNLTGIDPSRKYTQTGLIAALRSELNTSKTSPEVAKRLNRKDGRINLQRVEYRQRNNSAVFAEATPCDGAPETFKKEVLLSANTPISNKASISVAQMRQFCTSELVTLNLLNPDPNQQQIKLLREVSDVLMTLMDSVRRKMDETMLAQFALYAGANIGGTGTYQWIELATDAAVFKGLSETLLDFDLQQISNPFLVGGGNLLRFMNGRRYYCCNDGGIDLSSTFRPDNFNFYKDTAADTILGANKFAAFEPGAAQLATQNFQNTMFTVSTNTGDTVAQGYLPDPFLPGIGYDVEVLYDSCTKNYVVSMSIHCDLFAQPTDGYTAGDPLENTNGLLVMEATAA